MTKLNVREFILITASVMSVGIGFVNADDGGVNGMALKATISPVIASVETTPATDLAMATDLTTDRQSPESLTLHTKMP